MQLIWALLIVLAVMLAGPDSMRASQDWDNHDHYGQLAVEISRQMLDAVRESLRASGQAMRDARGEALQESYGVPRDAWREASRANGQALRSARRELRHAWRESWRAFRHHHPWDD